MCVSGVRALKFGLEIGQMNETISPLMNCARRLATRLLSICGP